MTDNFARVAAAWLLLCCCACDGDPNVQIDPPTAGTGGTLPPPDSTLVCDQAADGTPCDEPQLLKHCVFNVCSRNLCGDSVPAGAEQCDDGNDHNGDGCNAHCEVETGGVCGNGNKEGAEECDDGNPVDGDVCANACTLNVCRNGRIDVGEECDDGNVTDSGMNEHGEPDTCSNNCTQNECGNMRVDPGEECDDGDLNNENACASACTENRCGNSRVDPGEVCDGGRNEAGAPCRGDCQAYGLDACLQCSAAHCRADWGGNDYYAACREMVPPNQGFLDVPTFVTLCTAFDDCMLRTHCFDPLIGAVACYCGAGVDPSVCQAGTVVTGPCQAEAIAAALPVPGIPVPQEVFGRITDASYPLGASAVMAICRAEQCQAECFPSQ